MERLLKVGIIKDVLKHFKNWMFRTFRSFSIGKLAKHSLLAGDVVVHAHSCTRLCGLLNNLVSGHLG